MHQKVFVGELDIRVSVVEIVGQKSPLSGSIIEKEQLIKNCWAKIEDLTSQEKQEGKIALYATKEFIIRYDKRLYGVGATQRVIKYQDKGYDIFDVSIIGRKRYLSIKAVKRE